MDSEFGEVIITYDGKYYKDVIVNMVDSEEWNIEVVPTDEFKACPSCAPDPTFQINTDSGVTDDPFIKAAIVYEKPESEPLDTGSTFDTNILDNDLGDTLPDLSNGSYDFENTSELDLEV